MMGKNMLHFRLWPNICTDPYVNLPEAASNFSGNSVIPQQQAYFQMVRYNMEGDPSQDTPTCKS